MNDPTQLPSLGDVVPDDVIPHGTLPPMTYRDLPEPVSLRKMLGPSIILAGLALGSGEFIIWPYITYKSQFIFFWACILGVTIQYFLNMEITRWALATGESAISGFIRLNKHWAWIFLILNIVPWMIPAWSKGAAQIVSWLIWGPTVDAQGVLTGTPYATPLAIAGMFMCGAILTAGPVIYNTVEKIQTFLVSLILLLVILLAIWLVSGRPDAIIAQVTSIGTLGWPEIIPAFDAELTPVLLLGALAFAGAGGTTNLGQSNYIKDKGYGMGHYIGRITSPITGQQEAISEVGYHFPHTPENMRRWRLWWKAAGREHFLSFYLTCLICLVLLSLISYVLFYDATGQQIEGAAKYNHDIGFIWGEAELIGGVTKTIFLLMGIAILLTTEFGVLDVASRISADIVKVAWLRGNNTWSESHLYYLFLWGSIFFGSGILLLETVGINVGAFTLFKLTAALNGMVMFLYSVTLFYLNSKVLPPGVRMSRWRALMIGGSILFFGFFSVWAAYSTLIP